MNMQRAAVALSVLNLLVLVFLLTQMGTTSAQTEASPQGLSPDRSDALPDRCYLIDRTDGGAAGSLRTGIPTVPAGPSKSNRPARIFVPMRAKFGADERGSALLLMDDRTEATVRMRANKDGGGLSLYGRDGKKRDVGQ